MFDEPTDYFEFQARQEVEAKTGSKRHSDQLSAAGTLPGSMKDNKILYSNKTRPKRTKSQEHLPTYKRTKSPTS